MGGDMVGGNMGGDMVGANASVHVRHTTQTTSATSTRATSIPQDPFPCPRSADNAGAAALVFLATKGNSVEDLVVFLANAGGIPPIVALVRNGNDAQKASAAAALSNLAAVNDASGIHHLVRHRGQARHIQELIGSAGGIPPLVALTRDGTDAQKANAAFALAYLAASQSGRISECVQMDAERWSRAESLPTLVALVREMGPTTRKNPPPTRCGSWSRFMVTT